MATHPAVHPSADALRAFALGKRNDSTAAALMDHLDGCPDCCKQLAALSSEDFVNRLRKARGHSSTSAPGKAMSETAAGPKPPVRQPAIPNLPPELAKISQYEILRELGRGGMGVVYLAKNELMDRLEVLKVVNKALLDHPGAIERFLREIRAAAKLHHANVVGAYSALQEGELLAFAMEYVEGEDLANLVKSQGPLPVLNACYYIQQAASGLQHAFDKGMVHRDIKPQNLILAREGKKHIVKVLDFGLAKVMREKSEDTGLTGEGRMLGTPDYVAPEQSLDAARADIRADIYSLGCTLYYLLAGNAPFKASSLTAVLLAHQLDEAKSLNLVRPEVPEELAALVRKMMAKSPAQRYQTPLEVVQALNPFVKKRTTQNSSQGLTEAKPVVKKEAHEDQPPVPSAEAPKKQSMPAALRESRTESGIKPAVVQKSRTARERQSVAALPVSQKKWLIGGGLGVGVLLLALLGMWAGGVFKVKTKDGNLVLENLPADAEVMVDGQRVTFDTGDGKPVEVRVAAGKKHQLQVKKDGFKVFGQEVEIEAGDQQAIRVRLQPEIVAAKPRQRETGKASKPPLPLAKTVAQSPPLGGGRVPRQIPPQRPKATDKPPPPTPNRLSKNNGFVPLFNGKDLTGWKTYPKQPNSWKVVDGVIVGSGPLSHLFSERGDYQNFHYRVEAMINDGGNSGQYFRAHFGPNFPKGYEAQINSTGRDPIKTGSLYGIFNVTNQLHNPDEWFTQEGILEGDHIVIKVNGNTVVDTHDSRYKKGHFALQQHDSTTVVKFRIIEIKELPLEPSSLPTSDSTHPESREAAKAYEKACADARAKLLADFDKAIEQLAKSRGQSETKLHLIDIVKEERARFESSRLIPWSGSMHLPLARYFSALAVAREKLTRAYLPLLDKQIRAKNERLATELREELRTVEDVHVVATWKHILPGRAGINTFYSNGRINAVASKNIWSYEKGILQMRWPNAQASGGAFVDTCTVSADGARYEGTNQMRKVKIVGEYVK